MSSWSPEVYLCPTLSSLYIQLLREHESQVLNIFFFFYQISMFIVQLPIARHWQSFEKQTKHLAGENMWLCVPCSYFPKLFWFSCFHLDDNYSFIFHPDDNYSFIFSCTKTPIKMSIFSFLFFRKLAFSFSFFISSPFIPLFLFSSFPFTDFRKFAAFFRFYILSN